MTTRGRQAAYADPFFGMSDMEKKAMCLDLLHEFGAQNIVENGDELQHSCVLPLGMHAHGDRSGSASINWRKLAFHCFVCGGGGLTMFVSTCRGDTFGQVRDWIEEKTELGGEEGLQTFLSYLESLYSPAYVGPPPPIPHFNAEVLRQWRRVHYYLTDLPPEGRGIPKANVQKHQVGYDEKLDRIVFPLWWKDELVGWQTRRIHKDGSPKYKCSPDFPRDRVLYNSDVKSSRLVLVESPMTVVAKTHLDADYGFVGTFGSEVSKKQLQILADYPDTKKLILWYDNDNAGWKATRKIGDYLSNFTDVSVVPSPWNEDPGGLDDETVLDLLSQSQPYAEWRPPTEVLEWKGVT